MSEPSTAGLVAGLRALAQELLASHFLRDAALATDAADRLEANTAEMLDLQHRLGQADENTEHAQAERDRAHADLRRIAGTNVDAWEDPKVCAKAQVLIARRRLENP